MHVVLEVTSMNVCTKNNNGVIRLYNMNRRHGGLKTGPCLKPLGARKIYPVLI